MHVKDTIRGFDGIRGIAALMVVLTHLHVWYFLEQQGWLPASALPMLGGGSGVQAFFILSGFLISLLLIREQHATGGISIKKFIVRRSLRILPLYLLFCVIATGLALFPSGAVSGESLLYVWLYIYNFVPVDAYSSVLGHTWSLAVEEHFYLVWPVLFSALYFARQRMLCALLVLFIGLSVVIHAMLLSHGVSKDYFVERWSFIAGYNIALGCLAALLLSHARFARLRLYMGRDRMLALGCLLYANSLLPSVHSWFVENVVSGYLRSLGILLVIIWIYLNQASRLTGWLEAAPLKYLGKISYGIYMWQGVFLATGPNRVPGQSWPPSPASGAILLIVVAPLSFHYFEKYFLEMKKRYAVQPGTAAR